MTTAALGVSTAGTAQARLPLQQKNANGQVSVEAAAADAATAAATAAVVAAFVVPAVRS